MFKVDKLLAVFEAAGSDLRTQCKMIQSLDSLEYFQSQCNIVCGYIDLARQQLTHEISLIINEKQKNFDDLNSEFVKEKNKKHFYKKKYKELAKQHGKKKARQDSKQPDRQKSTNCSYVKTE